jgi:RNA polymerase sigma-70 factor (ECF subfamily)
MSVQNFSDSKLVSAFLSGDPLSIEYLILRHKDKVFSFILSKVKDVDLANDLFQDIFIRVIDKLREGKYNEEGKFISWLMRISHNMIMDHFRRDSRNRMVRSTDDFDVFDILAQDVESKEDLLFKAQMFKNLNVLISQLSLNQREVLEMRYFSSMSFKEISEESGISINTALGRMRYAIINLRPTEDFDVFDVLAQDVESKEDILFKAQMFKNLNVLIGHLSLNQREVLEMRYFSSMSFKEISEESGISINTALGRMRYAIINLRKLQEKHQINLSA